MARYFVLTRARDRIEQRPLTLAFKTMPGALRADTMNEFLMLRHLRM